MFIRNNPNKFFSHLVEPTLAESSSRLACVRADHRAVFFGRVNFGSGIDSPPSFGCFTSNSASSSLSGRPYFEKWFTCEQCVLNRVAAQKNNLTHFKNPRACLRPIFEKPSAHFCGGLFEFLFPLHVRQTFRLEHRLASRFVSRPHTIESDLRRSDQKTMNCIITL